MAVADELRARGAEVSFLGTRERIEAELVPAAGYEIDFVKVRGIDRRNPLRAARAGLEALGAVGAARKVLRQRRADVVIGGGGFVAGPAGLAAVLTRVPLVLTEADSHLGLANRLLAGRARRVCLAFPIEGREGQPYLVTGRPVPQAVLEGDRTAARAPIRGRRRRTGPVGRRRQPGRPFDQLRRNRSLRRATERSCPRIPGTTAFARLRRHPYLRQPRLSGARAVDSPRRPTRSATPCWSTSRTSATPSPPPTWCWGAPAARSSRWRRPAGRRSLFPTPSPPPTTRPPTPSGCARAAPRA